MKVIACLSWWDERPDWLSECVKYVSMFASHIVAVDGAYAGWPGGTPDSPREQADAIRDAAEGSGIRCTMFVPTRTWHGDEVGKRAFVISLAQQTPADWFFWIDADEH